MVEIQGVITDPEPAVSTLVRFRESDKIKAIILHIDSPGGGVAATQEIYQEVLRTKKVKPVIASVGGVAASGGLYVASAADKITANSGSVTGSIGVIMQMMNVEDLLDKVGVRSVVIKSGKFKDIGSPTRPMTEEERAVLQEVVSKLHRQFVRDVAAARGLDQETVAELADGRIFTGEEAVGLKLIDRIGGFRDAVDLVKEMAGIEGKVRLVYPAADKSWLKEFLENQKPHERSARMDGPACFVPILVPARGLILDRNRLRRQKEMKNAQTGIDRGSGQTSRRP